MNNPPNNITHATREKAIALVECAKKIGLNPGNTRYNSSSNFMSYWFTNGLRYIIVFCQPNGYMAEIYETNDDGEIESQFSAIKNIRNFLLYIKREKIQSFDDYFNELSEFVDMDDNDVKNIVQQFLKEEEED